MKIIFNPIIFKLQTFGGISRLWSQLTNIKTINILNIAKPAGIFTGCTLNICRPSRIIFSKKNSITINSYHTITLGFGKSICICHDLMEERKTDILSKIKKLYIFLSYYSSNKIICISEKTLSEFRIYYPNMVYKCTVIHNPLSPSFSKSEIRKTYIGNNKKLKLVYVGKRSGEKNFKGINELTSSNLKNFTLDCVCPLFTAQEKLEYDSLLSEGKIRELGQISDHKLLELYSSADFLFLPSTDEGFGFPIIESLSMGTPVLILYPSVNHVTNSDGCFVFNRNTTITELDDFCNNWQKNFHGTAKQIRRDFDINIIIESYRKQILDC